MRRSTEKVILDSFYDNEWNSMPPRNWRFSSLYRPQFDQEDHQDEYRSNSAPHPHSYLPPAHRTNADQAAGRIGRREDYSTVEEPCHAYLPQYDGVCNRVVCEENTTATWMPNVLHNEKKHGGRTHAHFSSVTILMREVPDALMNLTEVLIDHEMWSRS